MAQTDNGAAEPQAVKRREFLTTGGAAAVGAGAAVLAGAEAAIPQAASAQAISPEPARAQDVKFDAECDVVVAGGGCGGFVSALISRWLGNSVVILEKAAAPGGTTQKAAFWYWVPNNEPMRAMGLTDPKPDFLRYVARLSQPQRYDPQDPQLGLTAWEYAMCEAIYDSASPAVELLKEKNALVYRHVAAVPDYFVELPEDKAPKGRVLVPSDARESMSDGGAVAIASMLRAAERDGVEIRTRSRVQRVVLNGSNEVIGVEAATPKGNIFVRARKAVIFATGGYTHNVELRKNFLNIPIYGGCAALSNEGDFVRISSTLGVQLRNMNYAWCCPVSLEKAVRRDPAIIGMFSVAGDSMIFVNKHGSRCVNEKLNYNELAQQFFVWDGANVEYPNLVLISIWDQRSQDNSASTEYGRLIVPPGSDDRHVIKGANLEELGANISERLKNYAHVTGGLALSPDFVPNLKASIERFNDFAKQGKDLDFHRGDRTVEVLFNGDVKEEPGRKNVTMWPISDQGPYYAALVTGGTLDTKGGPKTNPDGQVLDSDDKPIPGLYGVGNCVASASGRAYWSGGATLGPIIAFAYRAANRANAEPKKTS